ncbi:hypothetical protein LTR91_003702 [Friedmanniomyces endolithicus]|uniref:Amidase domain-containing protein n=2 Tax=Dothideomycetidae TaxID=451867 RepID=A0AAN6KWV7_9PEZI|nr:hypothetical protein LTR94_023214 [Friedmanniomyces endolithicus]KAK5145818.1 hypothetical protein LTR32_002479 [Rachicladosporium monterosium]KAK0770853.1 hypothetical protein LTR75_017809 [Friedmanniomyces endolithicus]KAK0774308.1 hypothetical protein LTR38_016270 [Friedmanniomyces endolithicus]KAK0844325.1 hypothetical protein LTS02_015764 [Friedmanniomyces endolithicus]
MGTYAMKPTFSTTAGGGVKAASIEFDTIGYYFARCMEDLQLITDVLGLPAEESIKKIPPKEARVGFVKSLFWSSAGSGTIAAMEKAAETLLMRQRLTDIFKVTSVTDSGVSGHKDYLLDTTRMMLDPAVRAFVDGALKYPREEVRQAFDYYAAVRPALDKIAARSYALKPPSAIDEASLGLGDMGSPIFNSVWTVPASAGPNAMPVGLSLVVRTYCDQYLLSIATILAEALMKEGGWQKKLVHD